LQWLGYHHTLVYIFHNYFLTELRLGIERAVFVVLDSNLHKGLGRRAVTRHVGRGDGGVKAREGKAGRGLVEDVGSGGQRVGHALGGQVCHLFNATHQDDVVHSRGHGDEALAQRDATAGAGILDAGGRARRESDPVGHQWGGVPLTLEQVLDLPKDEIKKAVADLVAKKLITNVHERGNCSVVCMQRLPYDLKRGALQEDTLQGFKINANLDQLKKAKLILNDSVGAGMTRSSFLQKL